MPIASMSSRIRLARAASADSSSGWRDRDGRAAPSDRSLRPPDRPRESPRSLPLPCSRYGRPDGEVAWQAPDGGLSWSPRPEGEVAGRVLDGRSGLPEGETAERGPGDVRSRSGLPEGEVAGRGPGGLSRSARRA